MRRFPALVLLVLLGSPAILAADVLIVEKVTARSGDRRNEAVRSTYVKGTRMRVEVAQKDKTVVTLYDLAAGESIELDIAKRKATVRAIAARNAKLQKDYPREDTTVTVTPLGTMQTIAGSSCDDQRFAIRVPITSKREVALMLDGTACVARAGPGVDDYHVFAEAGRERNLVIGPATGNFLVMALVRGQTELFRALTANGGMPLTIDLTFDVDGKGVYASLVRKIANGGRLTTVTRLDAAPRDDAIFVVPAGWKRELKQ